MAIKVIEKYFKQTHFWCLCPWVSVHRQPKQLHSCATAMIFTDFSIVKNTFSD